MLFASWEIRRIAKNCERGLENARSKSQFFALGTDGHTRVLPLHNLPLSKIPQYFLFVPPNLLFGMLFFLGFFVFRVFGLPSVQVFIFHKPYYYDTLFDDVCQ